MNLLFSISSVIAIVSTLMVITRKHPVHALLYLIVSFLAIAVVIYQLGAPFIAILELIIYAGAIMVLFIFTMMLLNLGKETIDQERKWLQPQTWTGPVLLSLILLVELIYLLSKSSSQEHAITGMDTKIVAQTLFGPYLILVELAALLLTAGIVGAAHIGQHKRRVSHRFLEEYNE
ncbi:NADH-quinone oxidoreductase subunit J [Solitalea koreensis]|uniref:NADH-quinone oxidoreductase subunit J n=1 Tax=Solitalea koreensis TaxID=543615 RepID=A0A521ALH9_9SPHI|nr:NADH-quinone oxidoreductase subunit J [Solitalea koreensis]SMO35631.1 NADH dehydrogenase subunit J [Solitalea koreensis]